MTIVLRSEPGVNRDRTNTGEWNPHFGGQVPGGECVKVAAARGPGDGTAVAMQEGMRLCALVILALCGCGGTEGPPVGGGIDGSPGAAAHATDMAGAPAGAMDGKLGSPCNDNDQCDSHLCNPYPAKGGNKCSNTCDASNVAVNCPSPAVGCNNMGVCKF